MNTDQRETMNVNGSFYPQIKELFDKRQPVAILYEDHGVTRANGHISDLFERDGANWMKLDGAVEIRIDKLYAVNGTFSSDYSEC